MRPQVGTQHVAQVARDLKLRFAVPDPFEDTVTPMPLRHEAHILLYKVDREVHPASIGFMRISPVNRRSFGEKLFGLNDVVGHIHDFVEALYIVPSTNHQWRKLVKLVARYLNKAPIAYNVHISPFRSRIYRQQSRVILFPTS